MARCSYCEQEATAIAYMYFLSPMHVQVCETCLKAIEGDRPLGFQEGKNAKHNLPNTLFGIPVFVNDKASS